LQLESKSK